MTAALSVYVVGVEGREVFHWWRPELMHTACGMPHVTKRRRHNLTPITVLPATAVNCRRCVKELGR